MARSFVDPDTNTTLIRDFDPARYLAWLEGRPLVGRGLLANFLHEWTHRSCNMSRVGSALALLKLRSAIRTFNELDATADYLRCMTATALLEPLSEGLALFAEFDAYPGDSELLSPTLTAAGLHFAPAIGSTEKRPLVALEALLQELRRNPAMVERKGDLYVWPNQYLIGYLAVKSLWAQLAIRCRTLRDRDLYLAYLRSYVYDDPGLGIALLEPERDEHVSGERIANHLNDRLRTLSESTTLTHDVERWMASALVGSIDVETIGATAESAVEFDDLFTRATVEDFDRIDQRFTAWMWMTIQERAICALGSAPAAVRAGRDRGTRQVIVKPDGPVIANVDDDVPLTEDGLVTLVLNETGRGHMKVLSVGKTVRHLNTMGECSPKEIELACRHVANSAVSSDLLADFRQSLDEATVTTLWEVAEPLVRQASETIYAPLCTLNAADDEWRDAYATLKRDGLHAMLGGDAELTRAVAAVSLATSFSDSRFQANFVCSAAGIDQADFERAVALESAGGLPIMLADDTSVLAFV